MKLYFFLKLREKYILFNGNNLSVSKIQQCALWEMEPIDQFGNVTVKSCINEKCISGEDQPVICSFQTNTAGYSTVKLGDKLLTVDGKTEFTMKYYNLKSSLGIVHWGGATRSTEKDFLFDGAKMVWQTGSRAIKLYLGVKSSKTYSIDISSTKLSDIAQHESYQRVFNMNWSTIVLISHAVSQSIWKKSSDEEFLKILEIETEEIFELACILGKKSPRFIISNWESDCIVAVNKTSKVYDRMVKWVNARQSAVDRYKKVYRSSKNVFHCFEVNRVTQTRRNLNIPSTTTYVLPRIETDYTSYSCYDCSNSVDFEKNIKFIMKRTASPLIIGEFGAPINKMTLPQVNNYVFGILEIVKKYSIELAIYWHIFDKEKTNQRGFGLITPEGNYTSIYLYLSSI